MSEPRELVDRLEQSVELPSGIAERFAGYGVMGVPFASGDILAMRRWPASSLGEPYTSVWHRDPRGKWTFYSDVPPNLACPRYFGSAISEAVVREIGITWTGPRDLTISLEGDPDLDWRLSLSQTPATRVMNAMAGVLPDALWRREEVLNAMGKAASVMLGAGRLGLTGRAPNHQRFMVNPTRIWSVRSSTARMADQDLGSVRPLPAQTRLGDFWIPQRGIFAIGGAFFEPLDPARHALATVASG
ncbi:MAG: hypothetical protein H0U55_10265 [Rubrobacteraceae bacterium]|nr:hypothetical protein [Rubrobacteraceae bacterium]